jgi:hypothetical protein
MRIGRPSLLRSVWREARELTSRGRHELIVTVVPSKLGERVAEVLIVGVLLLLEDAERDRLPELDRLAVVGAPVDAGAVAGAGDVRDVLRTIGGAVLAMAEEKR